MCTIGVFCFARIKEQMSINGSHIIVFSYFNYFLIEITKNHNMTSVNWHLLFNSCETKDSDSTHSSNILNYKNIIIAINVKNRPLKIIKEESNALSMQK